MAKAKTKVIFYGLILFTEITT